MDQYEIARAALEKKQLPVAERGFTAILKTSPRHVPATRSLAIVRFMQKRHSEALSLVRKAIDLDAADVESPIQLVEMLLALKKHDEALTLVEQSCEDHVGSVLAWGTLLKVLRALGRESEFETRMLRALDAHPASADLMLHIGNFYGKRGEHARALEMFNRITSVQANHPDGLLQKANAQFFLKQYDAALASYDAVLRLDPHRTFALTQKGNALLSLRRAEEAVAVFGHALALDPQTYDGLVGIGAALWELGRLDEALTFLQSALQVNPRGTAAFNNLGQVMAAYKADADAIILFDRVHEIDPESTIDARISAATSSLRLGNYIDGWRRYESRIPFDRLPIVDPARYSGAKRWNGEDLTGKTLLVVPEQGAGDTIQFCRYVPMIAGSTTGRVIFAADRNTLPLIEPQQRTWGPAGNLRVVAHDAEFPPCDYVVPLMSLPMIFGTRVETIPSAPRYLSAPAPYVAKWAAALPDRGRLRIGIAWSGNPNHMNDRHRSMPIRHLAPLVSDTTVDWVVMQPGLNEHDRKALATVPHVLDSGAHIKDFADTAALIDQLDVVVAVDTSVAHLAGALGKPVFLMLPWAAEWRWFHDRTDSPWYSSARLFRQPTPGNWDGVIDDVQQALIAFAREKAARTAPAVTAVNLEPASIVL